MKLRIIFILIIFIINACSALPREAVITKNGNGMKISHYEYTLIERMDDYAVMESEAGKKEVFEFKDYSFLRGLEKGEKTKIYKTEEIGNGKISWDKQM